MPKNNNNQIMYIIVIVAIIFVFNKGQTCSNTCASNHNQRPLPNCECYLDNDNDFIPDIFDPDPTDPFEFEYDEGEEGFIDSDGDGWGDDAEDAWGSDENDPNDYPYQDMDGDGYYDEEEEYYGTDPNNPNDYPGSDDSTDSGEEPVNGPTLTPEELCEQSGSIYNAWEYNVPTFEDCKLIGRANCEALGLEYAWTGWDNLCCITNCKDAPVEPEPTVYTNSECFYLKDDYGRLHHSIVDNEEACIDYVFAFCDSAGMTGWLTNWLPSNCCLFDCKNI